MNGHNENFEIVAVLPLFISMATAWAKMFHIYGADFAVLLSICYTGFRFYKDFKLFKKNKND